MGDYSTVYSKNTLFAIKEYLEKNIYPEEITSIDSQKTKKNCKRKWRVVGKVIYNRRNYCKIVKTGNKEGQEEFNIGSMWKIEKRH